jgi:hypothetical protein
MLSGNEDSVNAFRNALNKKITALSLGYDDALHFTFEDGYKMRLFDDGQSCCESRYMRTDDDLDWYVGSVLLGAEIREAPDIADDDSNVHEVQFLVVETDKGSFTLSSHNEHNGYYGGFSIRAAKE